MKFFFSNQMLDTDTRELSRENMPVSLEPQVFDLVVHLMENRDRVVSKEELIDKIWKGRHVAELTLTSRINAARKAVGDSGSAQTLIRTIARKGFRFVARRADGQGRLRRRQNRPQRIATTDRNLSCRWATGPASPCCPSST